MKLRALLAVPLLLLVGAALEALAQACTCEGGPLRRTLAVNVLDEQGNQVSGLTAANFRAEFRGQPVKILSAALDTQPRRIVLLVDVSESMAARVGKGELAARPAGDSSDPSGARTALRDAVVEATRLLAPGQSGDVIYLITDGFDTFSQ